MQRRLFGGILSVVLLLVAFWQAQNTSVPHDANASNNAPPPTPTRPEPSLAKAGVPTSPASGRGFNTRIENFAEAKRLLRESIYKDNYKTFYCACDVDHGRVNVSTCGYQANTKKHGNIRIEWEHIVPASVLGNYLPEWRDGHVRCTHRTGKHFRGRECAGRVSKKFQMLEADMHNLVPALGPLNRARSNLAYGDVPGEMRSFGRCDFEISKERAEPMPSIRGFIARAYLYMNMAYPESKIIHEGNQAIFTRWDLEHPPEPWECERNTKIKNIQGNENSFITKRCP